VNLRLQETVAVLKTAADLLLRPKTPFETQPTHQAEGENSRNFQKNRGGTFMASFLDIFQWQTLSGDKLTVGSLSLTPQSQALTLRWGKGGWVWNRPVALLVEGEGHSQRIPIIDVTRVAQVMLWGVSLGLWLIFLMKLVQTRRKSK
jgi:hypothetical protein